MKESNTAGSKSMRTERALIQSASALMRERGFEKTTIREICKNTGMSIGAFYHHFASKEELAQRAFVLFDETLSEMYHCAGTPEECIKYVLLTQVEFIVKEAGTLITEYYKRILMDKNKSAASPSRTYYQTVNKYVAQGFSQGSFRQELEPEEVTELLIKFVRGCVIDWCLHDCAYDVAARTGKELDLILSALRP